MSDTILIIGGGIAGIQAALDAANAGAKVVLVEREGTIGGKMSVLDKNFPTLDCSICIEAPKMSDAVQHPNIEVLTLAEVVSVQGQLGNFQVKIQQKPRYVTDECTRCNDCVPVCPVILKNEFDVGMAVRKAIYTPIEQAAPGPYVIDIEHCLNEPPNYLPCTRCMDACAPECIDFDMKPKEVMRNVAAILVATGFDLLDPRVLPEYGYGTHPDILTSMEFERLLQASGPSQGEIIRPSNGKPPESLLFALCVGSRDQRFCRYCSRICCMYSIKEAYQALDHGIKNVTILYMDIRAYGKGFDEFHSRAREEGVRFIRGRPAEAQPLDGRIQVRFENTELGRLEQQAFDMVVLAPAIIPMRGTPELSRVLEIDLDQDGFIAATEVGGDMIATSRPGVYACGCTTGPKDIADSVTEAGAAVANALALLTVRMWPEELQVIPIDPSGELRIGVFLCDCGSNIAGTVDVPDVLHYAQTLEGVVYAEEDRFSCSGSAQTKITDIIKEKRLTRAVVAACSPKTHGPTFQRVCSKAGLNPYLLEMANVRNQDSWVHKKEREAATQKAKDMVKMAVAKAHHLQPLTTMKFPVTQKALVVGGGVAGMTAAANLAQQGFETHLVEKEPELGGMLRYLDEIAPRDLPAQELLDRRRKEVAEAKVHVHTNTKVENISGFVGSFNAHLSSGENLDVGAVVLAHGANAYRPTEFGYGSDGHVLTSLELIPRLHNLDAERITFIACIGSRNEDRGCSRFCCQSMIRQALALRKQGKKVRVLYRDLRTFSKHGEERYEEACKAGVLFFQIDQNQPPEKTVSYGNGAVTFYDELSGHNIALPTDLLVLNIGLVPVSEEDGVAQQLKVSRDEEGFLLESHPKLGPVEAAVQGVFLAGAAQGPKNVREAVAQGLAAASKASAILARPEIEREPLAAFIDYDKCTFCQRCVPVCPYSAISGKLKESISLVQAMCMGCGTCAAECMVDAITTPGFTDDQIIAQIDAATMENAEKKVIIFACNWCSYAGADQAGIAKIQYPPSSRVIRTMCSGRISQKLVMYAFERGAGAVLVTGCHIGDCHYINANHHTVKRMERWQKFVKAHGLDERRLQLWWVSAAEGRRFAEKAREMDELVKSLPAEELASTVTKMTPVRGRAA